MLKRKIFNYFWLKIVLNNGRNNTQISSVVKVVKDIRVIKRISGKLSK